jgi:hypothetical protein
VSLVRVRPETGGWKPVGAYCYMPYSYLIDDNLADDFWTIRVVQ